MIFHIDNETLRQHDSPPSSAADMEALSRVYVNWPPRSEDDDGCRALCALCAGTLSSGQLLTAHPKSTWSPPVRERLLNDLPKTQSPFDGLPTPDKLSFQQRTALKMYNPNIINASKVRWLDNIRAIGYHHFDLSDSELEDYDSPQGPVLEVFKLKEPRLYWEDDWWTLPAITPGPNNAGLLRGDVLYCYKHFDEEEPRDPGPCMPFHHSCFQLFQTFMRKEYKIQEVESSLLYMSIRERLEDGDEAHYMSDLKYLAGGYEPWGWPWPCRPGFEYLVLDPRGNTLAISKAIEERAATNKSSFQRPSFTSNDIFFILPNEIKIMVVEHLRPKDAHSLTMASCAMFDGTNGASFWKDYAVRELPWLYELAGLAEKDTDSVLDYKDICLWMDELSQMNDPKRTDIFLSLVNRRRLWENWQELGLIYDKLDDHAYFYETEFGHDPSFRSLDWMDDILFTGKKFGATQSDDDSEQEEEEDTKDKKDEES